MSKNSQGRQEVSYRLNELTNSEQKTFLVSSWRSHLRARNLAPGTLTQYLGAVQELIAYMEDEGMPTRPELVTREHIESYVISVIESHSAVFALNRFKGIQQYWKWMQNEGEITSNPMERMKPPTIEEKLRVVFTLEELSQLCAVCEGREFQERRDMAIIRVLLDTGVRREELAGLQLTDYNEQAQTIKVMGKGRRERLVDVGNKTVVALDRYLRRRDEHRHNRLQALWLGQHGALTGSGVYQVVRKRAWSAGLGNKFPHLFRHAFAHYFLLDGGQEGDLMQLAGWKTRKMADVYAASQKAQRARQAHRALSLGDKL